MGNVIIMNKFTGVAIALLAWASFTGSAKSDQPFTMLWRESSGISVDKVATPEGFKVSPAQAVKPMMARSSRAPWVEFYLFADAANYYFGNTRKGTQLTSPEPGHWVIDGITGEISYSPGNQGKNINQNKEK